PSSPVNTSRHSRPSAHHPQSSPPPRHPRTSPHTIRPIPAQPHPLPFLLHLAGSGLSKRTIQNHVDNVAARRRDHPRRERKLFSEIRQPPKSLSAPSSTRTAGH